VTGGVAVQRPSWRSSEILVVAVALAVLVALAVALQMARDRVYTRPGPAIEPLLYVTSEAGVRRAALGYAALAADVEWIRALQHYGRQRHASESAPQTFPLLFPFLDRATTLDPHFNIAYRFGAIFLAEPPPGGPGRPDLAIALLKKGIAARPARWEYYQDIGFVYYWRLHDYRQAADWFDRGGRLEGAPWWLRSMAAVTLARGGDRSSSRLIWQQIRLSADNDWLRDQADLRLAQLDALDRIDQLHVIVGRHRAASGRLPESWGVLVRAGAIRDVPLDPSGTPFALDPELGRVSVAPSSALFPMPVEPPATPLQRP
jgi:hypothetical protein